MQPLCRFKVGARSSRLSKAQVNEVHILMKEKQIPVEFTTVFVESKGDKDKVTSLRTLDKTDFFTKEIDDMVIFGHVRIGIHSAKDLPEPLNPGLQIAALTQGLDPSDSLVMRPGMSFDTLPLGAIVATSCIRREECCRSLRPDFKFIDLRGTIEERLKVLESMADAVVIAECALIRLGLTALNRIRLPGKTAAGQGQLAIVCKKEDFEIYDLLRPLDCRRS